MKQKILTIFLLISIFFIYGCEVTQKPNNPLQSIEIDQVTMLEKYYVNDFDISNINLKLNYETTTKIIPLSSDMLSKKDLKKLSNVGNHSVTINYLNKTTTLNVNLVDKMLLDFRVDGVTHYVNKVLYGDSFDDLPVVPYKENYQGYWDVIDFSEITEDLIINAYYVNLKANTVEETLAYLNKLFKDIKVNEDIPLDTKFAGCNVTWNSNSPYITNEGKYTRPYQDTTCILKATITDGLITTTATYTIYLDGYKDISKNITSGYVYRDYFGLNQSFYDAMDIIYCAFVPIDVLGGFEGIDSAGASVKNLSVQMQAKIKNVIIPKARKSGSYVVVSLAGGGGASADTYSIIAKSKELRTTFANNIVKLINDLQADGVDIDWEIPKSSEVKNFTLMIEEIYNKVKANNPNHLVTAAIGAGGQIYRYDLTNSSKYLDYINVMSYSMYGSGGYYQNALYSRTGSHNTLNTGRTQVTIDSSVKTFNSLGVNNSKLIIGVAFYGKEQFYKSYWSSIGNVDYSVIKDHIESGNFDYFYDEIAKVPYLLSKDKTRFISYDDEQSIYDKSQYIISNGLAGMMFWESGGDPDNILVNAMYNSLKNGS